MKAKTPVAVAAILLLLQPAVSVAGAKPAQVPDVADGFQITPLVADTGSPTAIDFGQGDDGPDLFAALRGGSIVRYNLTWTPDGPRLEDRSTVADGFNEPLGVAVTDDAVYVSDSYFSADAGRTVGVVHRLTDDGPTPVVDKLPNGAHNTNHIRFGPDGRLHIANGNPNDDGRHGGPPDVFPYSGAILSVDAAFVSEHPQVLQWRDEDGDPIPADRIADHPVNEDFAGNVTVVANGFRNVFGVAFGPDDRPWTAMNGEDAADSVYRIDHGANYSFPFCLEDGSAGATGDDIEKVPSPLFPDADCAGKPTADALLGHHVCSTGLDFPTEGPWAFPGTYRRSVYVGECGPFDTIPWLFDVVEDDPTLVQRSTGHKVTRVVLGPDGEPTEVRDFVDGLVLPTDVLFGPQGAMYIADMGTVFPPFGLPIPLPGAIHRVAPAPGPLGPAG